VSKQAAIAAPNRQEVNGRALTVGEARPRKDRGGSRGEDPGGRSRGRFSWKGLANFCERTSEQVAKAIEGQIGNRRGQRTDKQRVQKTAQVDRQMATLPKSRFR